MKILVHDLNEQNFSQLEYIKNDYKVIDANVTSAPCIGCFNCWYVISNAGFVGGDHNKAHLEQYQCWCERAGIKWGGGLGIGGGIILHVLYKIMLIYTGVQIVITIISKILTGTQVFGSVFSTLLPGFANCIIIMLFLYCGMLLFEFILAWAIRNKKSIKNKYTRIMLPSFIFIIFANIFMALIGLLHGKLVFSLFKKVKYT
jgi:hypothetical protein